MDWYYAKDGVQHGPVSEEELKAALRNGEVGPGDLAWKDGMTRWKPVAEVPALAIVLPAAPPSPPPVEADSPYQPPSAPPGPPPTGPAPPGSGKATASLVLGIVGLLFSCIPCIGLILGILAVVFGGQVLEAGRLRPELQAYLGTARGGRVLGIIAIVLSVLAAVTSISVNVTD